MVSAHRHQRTLAGIRSCEGGHSACPRRGHRVPKWPSELQCDNNVPGLAARTSWPCYNSAFGSIGSQMLILRVSGIKKRASRKHTAGTAIGYISA